MKPSELAQATTTALASLVPKYLDTSCYALVNGGQMSYQALKVTI
jgi:hypothetical protein